MSEKNASMENMGKLDEAIKKFRAATDLDAKIEAYKSIANLSGSTKSE